MASMHKRHLVVLKNAGGRAETAPMKEWPRGNPDQVPAGLDATDSSSHDLRRGLAKRGWRLEEFADRVLVIRPDERGETSFADPILEELERDEDDEEKDDEINEEITFGPERDLQTALRSNIARLEAGLKIVDGGKERKTEAGFIDITAENAEGRLVAIELKAGMARPGVVAQALAYMAPLAETEKKKEVRGIVVAGDFPKQVVLAARSVPMLRLTRYAFQFSFEAVP